MDLCEFILQLDLDVGLVDRTVVRTVNLDVCEDANRVYWSLSKRSHSLEGLVV